MCAYLMRIYSYINRRPRIWHVPEQPGGTGNMAVPSIITGIGIAALVPFIALPDLWLGALSATRHFRAHPRAVRAAARQRGRTMHRQRLIEVRPSKSRPEPGLIKLQTTT